jgi:hypothetical protein
VVLYFDLNGRIGVLIIKLKRVSGSGLSCNPLHITLICEPVPNASWNVDTAA